jgi:hypothetical protein
MSDNYMFATVRQDTVERIAQGRKKLVTDCLLDSGGEIAIWAFPDSQRLRKGDRIEVETKPGNKRTLYNFVRIVYDAPQTVHPQPVPPPPTALVPAQSSIIWPTTIGNPRVQNNLGLYWQSLLGALEIMDQISPGDPRRIEHARNMAATVFIQSVGD